MAFKKNLCTIRKINHLSQEQLAKKIGVSRQSVSKWETGEAYPEMPNIIAICKIFHCKITDLIDIDSNEVKNFTPDTEQKILDLTQKDRKHLRSISKLIYCLARLARFGSLANFFIIGAMVYAMRYAILNWLFSGFPEWVDLANLNFSTFFEFGAFFKAITAILIIASFIVSSIYIYLVFLEIERFFKYIHNNKSPFSPESSMSLRKIVQYLTLWIVFSNAPKIIALFFVPFYHPSIDFTAIFFALIVLAFVYIFRYGQLLESSTNKN